MANGPFLPRGLFISGFPGTFFAPPLFSCSSPWPGSVWPLPKAAMLALASTVNLLHQTSEHHVLIMRSFMFYRCISFILRVRKQMPNLKGLCSKIFLCHWKVRHASSITRCYKCSLRRNVRVPRVSSQYHGWYRWFISHFPCMAIYSTGHTTKILKCSTHHPLGPHGLHFYLENCSVSFCFFNLLTCCKTLTFAPAYKLALFC